MCTRYRIGPVAETLDALLFACAPGFRHALEIGLSRSHLFGGRTLSPSLERECVRPWTFLVCSWCPVPLPPFVSCVSDVSVVVCNCRSSWALACVFSVSAPMPPVGRLSFPFLLNSQQAETRRKPPNTPRQTASRIHPIDSAHPFYHAGIRCGRPIPSMYRLPPAQLLAHG